MKQRNLTIDILRLVFAAIIVLHHSRYVLGYEHSVFIGGSLGVEFFFIVSGYLMMAHIERVEKRQSGPAQVVAQNSKTSGLAQAAGSDSKTSGLTQAAGSDSKTSGLTQAAGSDSKTSGLAQVAGSDGLTQAEGRGSTARAGGLGTETYHYILHKIKGILPEFAFALIIGFIFVAAAEQWPAKTIAHRIVKDFGEYTLLKMGGIFQSGIDGVIWYLSAMFLAMAILYPLIRRWPDMMKHVGLPLVTIFLFGYLCQSQGSPRDPTKWLGLVYKGVPRAVAEISLGGIAYLGTRHIVRIPWNRLGRALTGILELFCYLIPIVYMYREKPSAEDYFYIFLLFVGIMLTFSRGEQKAAGYRNAGEQNGRSNVRNLTVGHTGNPRAVDSGEADHEADYFVSAPQHGGKCLAALGQFCSKYSTALFLSHLYFAQHINTILPEAQYSGTVRMAAYLVLAAANGLLVMGLAALWRRRRAPRHAALRRLFLK